VNADEFTDLIEGEYPRLVRALALSCGDRQVAEDAVQEALVRAWERLERGDQIRSMVGWVAVVAMNETRTVFRRSATERRAVARLEAQIGTRPGPGAADDAVDGASVRLAILSLPERQRAAVVLHHVLDISVDDTAELLGVTPGAVKNALFNGRRHLFDRLGVDDAQRERSNTPAEGVTDG
jgi:RNA polymerase sigma-70 factor (ECF subfamily)